MTNEEAVRRIQSNMEYRKSWSMVHHDTLNTCISKIEENTKLQNEIDELKSKIVSLHYEIAELQSKLDYIKGIMPRLCETCKHEDVIGYELPCNSCIHDSNWEMKGQVKHESN